MARPSEFDRDQALRQAMAVFWRQGFSATSIRDLTQATRLQPGSLYGAFHSKRDLFDRALEAYFSDIQRFVADTLQADGSPLARIRRFFERLITQAQADPEHKGCLLVNTLLETPAEDRELIRRVGGMFEWVEGTLRQTLEAAQRDGELDDSRDPAALAKFLVAGIYGLRVYHKADPEPADLQAVIDGLMGALR